MLDRTQAPEFHKIREINILKVEKILLNNQIPVYTLQAGKQALVRIEWLLEAGNYYNQINGQAFFALKMLQEGTRQKTSNQINAIIDQYGAFLEMNSHFDQAEIILYCPTRFVGEVVPLIAEMLFDSVFPETELEILKRTQSQELQINFQKTTYLAGRAFRKALFGEHHPYGKSMEISDIEHIQSEVLKDFYQKHIQNAFLEILVSGCFDNQTIETLQKYFGSYQPIRKAIPEISTDFVSNTHKIFLEKVGSLQNTIRVGKRIINKHHPDYFKLAVANTILGGYFGSRLMQNIREEKGYTYGIFSNLQSLRMASFVGIGTDVKAEFTEATLKEIYKEIHLLQQEKVSAEELERVKNYMAGSFASGITTPFSLMDLFKEIHLHQVGYEFYDGYLDKIEAVTPEDVQRMIQEHYQQQDLLEIVAGTKISS
jgi:predicted Zn-dependent peptidase